MIYFTLQLLTTPRWRAAIYDEYKEDTCVARFHVMRLAPRSLVVIDALTKCSIFYAEARNFALDDKQISENSSLYRNFYQKLD